VLHHIYPEQRRVYVENVYKLLNPGGKYLSVCFSEKDPEFGGISKYRVTGLGTVLYFSSEGELRDLFEPFFNIEELKTIVIRGKPKSHFANYAFMERRSRAHLWNKRRDLRVPSPLGAGSNQKKKGEKRLRVHNDKDDLAYFRKRK